MLQRKPRDLDSMMRAAYRAGTLGSKTGRADIDAARLILERWGRAAGASIDGFWGWRLG